MRAALVVLLAGVGIGFLGLIANSLYFAGAVVAGIGAIGLLVRTVDFLRWLRR